MQVQALAAADIGADAAVDALVGIALPRRLLAVDRDALRRAGSTAAEAGHTPRRAVGPLRQAVNAAKALRILDLFLGVSDRRDLFFSLGSQGVPEEAAGRERDPFGDLREVHLFRL